jgi:quaternary ammonium compound-resistance protein SugE
VPSVVTVVLALGSFYLLSVAMKSLPVGTAYAVWVGIGAVGTAIAAVFLFQEPVSTMRVMGVLLILAGIAALKFA